MPRSNIDLFDEAPVRSASPLALKAVASTSTTSTTATTSTTSTTNTACSTETYAQCTQATQCTQSSESAEHVAVTQSGAMSASVVETSRGGADLSFGIETGDLCTGLVALSQFDSSMPLQMRTDICGLDENPLPDYIPL